VTSFISNLKKDPAAENNVKVSVILYDSYAIVHQRMVAPSQVDPSSFPFAGAGTDFEQAIEQAWEIASADQTFDKTILNFMTDGDSDYPAEAIQKFKDDPTLMKKIEFQGICFGDDANSRVIQQMVTAFAPNGKIK